MDSTEEIQKLVGKLVIDHHLQLTQLTKRLNDLYTENNALKEQYKLLEGQLGNNERWNNSI
mgnify:CR=1 FL=1